MNELMHVLEGGFAFLPGGIAYSQGVVALPGNTIEHVRFSVPVPLEVGFERVAAFLRENGRPPSALCAVELRSPEPLPLDGFREFNASYAAVLERWGLVKNGVNAVARSNVVPMSGNPSKPCLFAFSVALPTASKAPTFVVSGSSEWPEGGRFPEDVIRHGDTSPTALREKACYVLRAMERRMQALGVGWLDSTMTQSYSAYDVFDFLTEDAIPSGSGRGGVLWHHCRPPVVGWDYEMDVRGVQRSHVLREES